MRGSLTKLRKKDCVFNIIRRICLSGSRRRLWDMPCAECISTAVWRMWHG